MLNKQGKATMRYIKSINQTLANSNNELLALMSGLSREYFSRNKMELEQYYIIAPESTMEEIEHFNKKNLDFYLSSDSEDRLIFIQELGAIVGYLMKYKYNLLHHIQKPSRIAKAGVDVINLMRSIKSKKESKDGVRIHSKTNVSARRLFNHNKVSFIDSIFKRSGSYYNGKESKKWKLTQLGEQILEETVEIFLANLENIIQKKPNFLNDNLSISHINCDTYSSICDSLTVTLPLTYLNNLSLSSLLHILSLCIGFNHDSRSFIVSLEHTSSTDPLLGRTYNVFSRLRSVERKGLGYKNYDMSSALQAICLQLLRSDFYPLLSHYSTDSVYKRDIRNQIAKDLNIPVSNVKQKLTAFANGGISGIDKHPLYKTFQQESDQLRREVLAYVAEYDSDVLERATQQSKRHLPLDIDWYDLTPEDYQYMARNKASVFFFVWTWYERLIRQAMLTVLPNGIEVHDAVYSKQDIPVEIVEAAILDQTKFKIIIEKD